MLVRDLAKIRPRLAYYFGVGLEEYHSDIEPLVAEFLGKLRKKVVGKRNLQFASQKIEPQSTIEKLVFKDLEKIRTRSTEYLGVQMADYIRMFEPMVIRFLRKLKRKHDGDGNGHAVSNAQKSVGDEVMTFVGEEDGGIRKAA